MSREMEAIYTSTMGSYKKILGQFNPALENLVFLGNNYMRAIRALSEAAETYYNAIKRIGEHALQNAACQGLGQLIMQMADSCRTATAGLNIVFQSLQGEILQQMDKNTKLDKQFILDSQNRYEMEYRHKANTLDKCMTEVWRMERQRDRNLREMKENVNMLHLDMMSFVKESQKAAELEEKRRYRFLAEKQLALCNTFLQYHSRSQGVLQPRVSVWKDQIDTSRAQDQQAYQYAPIRQNSDSMNDTRAPPRSDSNLRGLQRTTSSGAVVNSQQRTRSNSFGEVAVAAVAAAATNSGNKRVQALVDHSTGGNSTLLPFSKGAVITVMVPEARNGWLYGRVDGFPKTGWFPEAYVRPVDQNPSSFGLRSAHSTGDLIEGQENAPQQGGYRAPPATSESNSRRGSDANILAAPAINNMAGRKGPASRGDLFPPGTNPFATVKLRPTVTNDRSAPIIR
uniref:BAR/IMD domain containing adaptor protein 2 like 2 n=1 Tax=Leptobrachium leishanense TaxID=445787 RepID=A0A8C5Q1B0_9ANUR